MQTHVTDPNSELQEAPNPGIFSGLTWRQKETRAEMGGSSTRPGRSVLCLPWGGVFLWCVGLRAGLHPVPAGGTEQEMPVPPGHLSKP